MKWKLHLCVSNMPVHAKTYKYDAWFLCRSIGHAVYSFKTSVALTFVIILQNLITTNHRKNGGSKYDRKLTELDVVTTRIRYRVNEVFED